MKYPEKSCGNQKPHKAHNWNGDNATYGMFGFDYSCRGISTAKHNSK